MVTCSNRVIIDSELRLLVAVRRVCREDGGTVPSTRLIDALLDERRELTRKLTALSKTPSLCGLPNSSQITE